MADPRLCSVHLEALPRRQDFRRAREALLGACGTQTLAANVPGPKPESSNTLIQNSPNLAPAAAGFRFLLMDKEFTYPLKAGLNTIGRLTDNDVVVDDACVSRRHCAIVVHSNECCEVHDVASKNGTYVNGKRIAGPTKLEPGDEIRMCNHQMVFLSKDATASKSPKPDQAITRPG